MGMEADLRSLDARVRAVEEVAQELTRVHERLKVLAWVCGVLGVAIGGVLWYAVGEAREALALAELAKKAAADAPQQVAAASRSECLHRIRQSDRY